MWWGAPDEPPLPRGDLLPQPPRPLQSSAVPVRGPWPTLTHHGGLQIDHDGPGHVLPVASLAEEGGEGVVVLDLAGLRAKSAIGLDAVLQAEELPAGIADLDPCLAHVDGYAFPLRGESSPVRAPARPRLCPRPPGPQAPTSEDLSIPGTRPAGHPCLPPCHAPATWGLGTTASGSRLGSKEAPQLCGLL